MYYFIDNVSKYNLEIGKLYEDEELKDIIEDKSNIEIDTDDLGTFLDERNIKYLYFSSKTKSKHEFYKALNEMAETDYEVNFMNLRHNIPGYKLDIVNSIQRSRHYGEAYLNRIVDMKSGKVYSGCLLHYLGFMVAARYVHDYNKYVDEIPFLVYNKLMIYLKGIGKQPYLNKINLGYNYDLEKIDPKYSIRNLRSIRNVSTPENPGIEFETMNLFNYFILTGEKLLPITEVVIE